VRATQFEFERRFWIICAIYLAGFQLSIFDHTSFIGWLRHLIAPSIARESAEAQSFARAVIFAGALLVFISAAIRTWAAAYLRTSVVHDTAQHSEALVADGPFRYVRNPLYLASVLMAAGIGVLASRSGFIFLVLANWFFVYRLIFREEEALRQRQGESYRAYCRSVPRFFPSLSARVPAGNNAPRWAQAFAGESFVWLFGIAEVAVVITLRQVAALIAFPLAFAAHFLITRPTQKRGSS
jgi:protein-S-isoprenylcysteine O-methyltransferase Ste14